MNKLKIIIKIIAFLILFAVLYIAVEFVLEERTSNDKYAEFFREKQDFPVLFMGNSHVTNDIFPMEMYHDYGIVSYNFGGHANTMPTTYWIIKNALDYTSPKLIVLDMRSVGSELLHSEKVRYLHISLDCFPMSKNKYEAVRDILPDREERNEFLWKMWIYHDRWDELEKLDFTGERKYEKGAESRINVSRTANKNDVEYDRSIKLTKETLGEVYLSRIIKECREKNIEVLLTYLPVSIKDDNLAEINSAADIAAKYDVNFINYNEMDLVDFDTDYNDSGAHLNPSGARKISEHLGKYIMDNYDIEDLRESDAYESWKKDWVDYEAFKEKNLREEKDPYNFIMLCADKNYEVSAQLRDPQLREDGLMMKLFDNAKITPSDSEGEGDLYFLVKKSGGQVVCERTFDLDAE